MAKVRPIVVAYDISKNKIRSRVRKILREWNLSNQKSVYECRLTRAQAEELFLQLSHEIDNKTDNLLMAWLEPRRQILTRGLGKATSMGKKLFYVP
ncbi:CRISPR-associated endonuclease Cas2 [Desulfobacter latus]|uniref:CRISPR-associated endoribonuclease Cas2 n=1 Tax=Desulfobacter latus TaxID=2292 RepID=A0A850T934_9BACT|nr:CRISPR-associated endonuclease Cas2 [Desulfobacter latus]NWH03866.1 CRISPR-associated endonuclease Cas2 [Desulfobacter latus]